MTDRAKGALVRISSSALRGVSPELRDDLRQMFAKAGLHFAEEGKAAIRIRSDGEMSGLIVQLPLQTADGRLRADVLKRLTRGSPTFSTEASRMFQTAVDRYGVALSRLGAWELRL